MLDICILAVFPVFLYYGYWKAYFLLALLLKILYAQLTSKPSLYFKPTEFSETIISKCPSWKKGYSPTFYLFTGLLQALFEGTFGEIDGESIFCDDVQFKNQEVALPDGGMMSIDWAGDYEYPKNIIVIGPGITGDSSSQYIRSFVVEALKTGFTVAVLQGRGIANNKLRVRC